MLGRDRDDNLGDGRENDLGVIILAGGKSSRLKINKVFLKIRGEELVSGIVRAASEISEDIVVAIGSKDREEVFFSILPSWVKIVKDASEKKAALFGALTGLRAVETDYAVVLAADLPFVNAEVIRILRREAEGFDLAIPRWPNDNIEPLYAVYLVSTALRVFEEAVESGSIRIRDAIDRLGRVNYVPVERFRAVDPSLRCFINLNTTADLERVKEILGDEADPACSAGDES